MTENEDKGTAFGALFMLNNLIASCERSDPGDNEHRKKLAYIVSELDQQNERVKELFRHAFCGTLSEEDRAELVWRFESLEALFEKLAQIRGTVDEDE